MRYKSQALICIMPLAISLIGCAPLIEKFQRKVYEIREEEYVETYLHRGRDYEDGGDLVEALKSYKIALTIDPSNQEAVNGRKRLEKVLRRTAEKHYKAGLKLQKEGKYGEARQQFLTALRLRPDHPEVIKILTSRKRIPIKRYVLHKVKSGESLSKLAALYYGDRERFSVIARYNNLNDATRIRAGQEIKIPEIEGVAFLEKGERIQIEEEGASQEYWDWYGLTEEEAGEVEPGAKTQEILDQLAIYREHGVELFKEQRYREAITEFKKVLCVNPDDSVSVEYTYMSYYRRAVALFEKQDYLAAQEQFKASLRYNNDCHECHAYIRRSEDLYKEMHYKRGIQHYGKERLVEAIKEWELVRRLDPNYKRVDYYIKKAKVILMKLEELKREMERDTMGIGGG
ncbi:MAG: tetratricopeptide repeat protein [Desulfobacteraceae bacterium]|jgi:tetratricopeptide (TPR) repeat protein